MNWKKKENEKTTLGREKQKVTLMKKNVEKFRRIKVLQSTRKWNQNAKLISITENFITDAPEGKFYEEFFFQGGHFNGRNFNKISITEAGSEITLAIETTRRNVDHVILSDAGYMLNK